MNRRAFTPRTAIRGLVTRQEVPGQARDGGASC